MNTLAITIIIIFTSTFIAGYVKSKIKDRCLKDFNKFPIIVLLKNGKTIWGKMELESTGIILNYPRPHENPMHKEKAFILYKPEYATLLGVFRPISDLDETEKKARELKSLVFKSGLLVRIRRGIRNFIAAVRDAVLETFSVFLGRVAPKSSVLSSNQKYVKKMGESFVDYIGNSYDPLLEKLIGKKIVYEVFRDDQWNEYIGILRNYTKDFLEIISTKFPMELTFTLPVPGSKTEHLSIVISNDGEFVEILNARNNPISVLFEDKTHEINPSDFIKFEKTKLNGSIKLLLEEEIDVIFPRSEAIVRHIVAEEKE